MAAVADAKTAAATFSRGEEEAVVTYDFAVDAGGTGALDLLTASQDMIVEVYGVSPWEPEDPTDPEDPDPPQVPEPSTLLLLTLGGLGGLAGRLRRRGDRTD